jgi:hypothetical protein
MVPTQRSMCAFAFGAWTGVRMTLMFSLAMRASKARPPPARDPEAIAVMQPRQRRSTSKSQGSIPARPTRAREAGASERARTQTHVPVQRSDNGGRGRTTPCPAPIRTDRRRRFTEVDVVEPACRDGRPFRTAVDGHESLELAADELFFALVDLDLGLRGAVRR